MEAYFQVKKSAARPKDAKTPLPATPGASSSKQVSGVTRQHPRVSASSRYSPYPSNGPKIPKTRLDTPSTLSKVINEGRVESNTASKPVLIEILDSSSPPPSPGKPLVSSQGSSSQETDEETRRAIENVAKAALAARRRKDILNMKHPGNPIVHSKAVNKTRELIEAYVCTEAVAED